MRKVGILILFLVVGLILGTGGTIVAQKLFFTDGQTAEAKPEPKKESGPVVSIGEFTVNLQGGSFLKTTIAVEGINSKSQEGIETKISFLQDRVNTVLSGKSLSDVLTPAAREKVRSDLLVQLNEVCGDLLQQVLFVTFVYQ